MTFIRAPYIEMASPEVKVMAKVDERIVGVRYKQQLAISFHPELDNETGCISTLFRWYLHLSIKRNSGPDRSCGQQ